jgi:50S ribosomal protein L16 3-hydroxylase
LGARIYCNGEEMTGGQTAPVKAAWRSLASNKQVTGSLGKIGVNNSLFEAFEAGWLLF